MEAVHQKNPKKSLKTFLIAGVATLVLAGGAVWVFSFSPWFHNKSFSLGNPLGRKNAAEKSPGFFYKMDPFIVNLMDPVQLWYLKGTIHLENSQEKMNEEFEKKLPHLIDNLLPSFPAKPIEES